MLRQACSTSGELAGSGASIPGAGTEAGGVPRREALAVLLAAARAAVCVQDERLAVTLCCGCPRDTVPLGCGAALVQASGGRGTFQLSFVPVPPAPGVCWGTAGIFPEPAARGISHFHAVSPRDVRDLHVHWHDLRSTMCGRHQGCPSCRVTALFLLALSNPVHGRWVFMQRERKNWGCVCWVLPQVLELSYFLSSSFLLLCLQFIHCLYCKAQQSSRP